MLEELIHFLRSQLQISDRAINLAQKTTVLEPHTLPIILWHYGILDTQQLERVFDWLEANRNHIQ